MVVNNNISILTKCGWIQNNIYMRGCQVTQREGVLKPYLTIT